MVMIMITYVSQLHLSLVNCIHQRCTKDKSLRTQYGVTGTSDRTIVNQHGVDRRCKTPPEFMYCFQSFSKVSTIAAVFSLAPWEASFCLLTSRTCQPRLMQNSMDFAASGCQPELHMPFNSLSPSDVNSKMSSSL